jgi:hypothetical protein
VKYKNLVEGKRYLHKRPFGGKVATTLKMVGSPLTASYTLREHTPDGIVTLVRKRWWSVTAKTEGECNNPSLHSSQRCTHSDGKVIVVKPENLRELEGGG